MSADLTERQFDPTIDRAALLEWGRTWRRDLPWRRTRDPWAVLVAEVMLQQTGVERVIPKWEAFLERFPNPAGCASSTLAEVLELWQGLGYPRRGRNLWLTARACAEQHGGELPAELDPLLALAGIGPYTARAVLTFAHELPVGGVDTNIARILARCEGRQLTRAEAQRVADSWVAEEQPWEWNQTLMDVGAGWCRPDPRCDLGCPLAAGCGWNLAGRPAPAHLPRRAPLLLALAGLFAGARCASVETPRPGSGTGAAAIALAWRASMSAADNEVLADGFGRGPRCSSTRVSAV